MDVVFIIQSFVVYSLAALVLYMAGKQYFYANPMSGYEFASPKGFSMLFIVALFFALLSGLRYLTGSDTGGYVEQYNFMMNNPTYSYDHFEEGWTKFCRVLIDLGCNAQIYLGIVAFIQICSLLFLFRRYPPVMPYLLLLLIVSSEFLFLWNGLRQVTVAYLFFPLLLLVERKRYILFVLAIYLMSFFHKSSYLLLLFYPLYWYGKLIIPSRKLQYSTWCLCIVLGSIGYWKTFMNQYFDMAGNLLNYDTDADAVMSYMDSFEKVNFGIRSACLYLIAFTTILFGNEIVCFFKDKRIVFFYNVFLFAVFSDALFVNARVFIRVFFYTQPFAFVTSAFLLYYLLKIGKEKHYKYWAYLLLLLNILGLAASIVTAKGDGTAIYKCILWDA